MGNYRKMRNPYIHSHEQADNHILLRKQDPSIHNSHLRRQTSWPWTSLLPPHFPELLLLSLISHDMEYVFGQFMSAVPSVSSPNFLYTPSLLTGDLKWEKEKASVLCKYSSATARTLLCYNSDLLTNPKPSTIRAAMKNSIPARPSTLTLSIM